MRDDDWRVAIGTELRGITADRRDGRGLFAETNAGGGKEKQRRKVNWMASSAERPRRSCMYGEKCFRKNLDHKKEFAHRGDPDYNDPVNSSSLSSSSSSSSTPTSTSIRKRPTRSVSPALTLLSSIQLQTKPVIKISKKTLPFEFEVKQSELL